MNPSRRWGMGVWWLALGYFLFYIPYSGLTKALSGGLLPGVEGPITGLELLPAVAMSTTVTLLAFITVTGGWSLIEYRRIFGLDLPVPGRTTTLSGIATATIIATTTLNYTFLGISIVFALLLMRGGVLILRNTGARTLTTLVAADHWRDRQTVRLTSRPRADPEEPRLINVERLNEKNRRRGCGFIVGPVIPSRRPGH